MFKTGDLIICIDNSGKEMELEKGIIYVVEDIRNEGFVVIDGGEFDNDKFEIYKVNVDYVNSPNHYIGDNGIEVEDVIMGFINRYEYGYVAHRVSSAIEYLLRSPLKNGKEDIEKAKKNLEQALNYLNSIDN